MPSTELSERAARNKARFQEIAKRGLQHKLDPDKRARFDEAVKRGLIVLPEEVSREIPPDPMLEGLQQEATPAELIAGSAPGRALLGAGRLLSGPFHLGAKIGDYAAEKMGMEPVVGDWVGDKLRELDKIKKRGMAAQPLEIPYLPDVGGEGMDIIGGAAEIVGGMSALTKAVPGVAGKLKFTSDIPIPFSSKSIPMSNTVMGRMGQGGVIGAGFGAAAPVEVPKEQDYFGEKAGQIGLGGILGGAIPVVGALAGKGAQVMRNVVDPWLPGGTGRVAARTLSEAAGSDKERITRLLRENKQLPGGAAATGEIATGAGEIAAPAGRAEFTALQPIAKDIDPSPFIKMEHLENLARIRALRTFGKDNTALLELQQSRKQISQPFYNLASESTEVADPTRTVNLIDRIIKKNPARRQLVNTLKQVRDGFFEEFPLEQRALASIREINKTLKRRMSDADFEALRSTRLILNRVKSETIDLEDGIRQLNKIEVTSKTALRALQFSKGNLKTPDFVLRQEPSSLISSSKNISDLLSQKGGSGEAINKAISRELLVIKKSIDHQINKAEPNYGAAQSIYSTLSKPIDQMKVGQELERRLEKALNANGHTGKQRAIAYAEALRDAPRTMKRATGFKSYHDLGDLLSPGQMAKTQAVKENLARRADYEDLAKAGAPRAKRITEGMTFSLPDTGMFSPIYSVIKSVSKRLEGKVQGESLDILTDIMQNPKKAAEMLEKVNSKDLKLITDAIRQAERGATIGAAQNLQ